MLVNCINEIIYGCIVGRFIQRVAALLTGKRGSMYGKGLVVGVFAVFTDNVASIAPDKFLLLGTTEYDNIVFRTPTSLFDILREAKMQSNVYTFDRIDVRQMHQYPDAYGSITSTGASGRFIDRSTQFALIKAFKEFTECQ